MEIIDRTRDENGVVTVYVEEGDKLHIAFMEWMGNSMSYRGAPRLSSKRRAELFSMLSTELCDYAIEAKRLATEDAKAVRRM